MIDRDNNYWWYIAEYDIADVAPNMIKGYYTFNICVGVKECNRGILVVSHSDGLDKLDTYGEIYGVLHRNLDAIVEDLQDEINIKIHSDIDPDVFSDWFYKTLIDKGYKSRIQNDVVNVIRKNKYDYMIISKRDNIMERMKRWLDRRK